MAEGHYQANGGVVRTYVLNGPVQWVFESELVPPSLDPIDDFGASIAFASDSLLAVGRNGESDALYSAGAADLFEFQPGGGWMHRGMITPQVRVQTAWFGRAITWATVGNRTFLIIGAPGSEGYGLLGSVYVFERDSQGVWQQQAHLQAPDGTPDNAFGHSVAAAEGDGETTLVVGAPGHLYVGYQQQGFAYIYRFEPTSSAWLLEDQVEAPDPYAQDFFAYDVSVGVVSDQPGITHRAVVGRPNEGGFGAPFGPGAVYVYERHADRTWTLEAHLTPPIAIPAAHRFGWAVDLDRADANRILAGAPTDKTFGTAAGSAFVFEKNLTTGAWRPVQGVFGHDVDTIDLFGSELVLGNGASSGQAIVGAEEWECLGHPDEDTVGAIYVFDLDPADGQGDCPAPVLTLQKDPDCAGGGGGRAEIEVRWFQGTPGAPYGGRIAILYSRHRGSFVVPQGQPCAGTTLGLGGFGLQVAFTGRAGQFGTGRIKTDVSRAVCGGFLQLVDLDRCAVSNVIRIQ